MERNARIILVVTFIVATVAGLIGFYRWIQGPDPNKLGVDTAIQFDGSVSGLSIGSEVRYLGVSVGRVSSISLSASHPGRVDVVFGSKESLPAAGEIVALLEAQGITGLSIIELRSRSEDIPGFAVPQGVIPGYPSLLSQLAGSAGRISSSVESTLTRINALLDDETAADLAATIRQLRVLSGNLSGASGDVDELLGSFARVSRQLEDTLPVFRQAADSLNSEVLPTVAEAGRSLQLATDSVATTLDANSESIRELLESDLPTLMGITDELTNTLLELNELLGNINDEPGALLYGKQVKEVDIGRE